MIFTVNQQNIYINAVWSTLHKTKPLMVTRTPARPVNVRRILDTQSFLGPRSVQITTPIISVRAST